jgi:hypothetical protein
MINSEITMSIPNARNMKIPNMRGFMNMKMIRNMMDGISNKSSRNFPMLFVMPPNRGI